MPESDLSSEEFSKLLFRTAFCLVACDGEIHEQEIEELKLINTNTPYFGDIDLESELNALLRDLRDQGTQTIHDLFSVFQNTKLSMVQELLLLEVALRVINADQRIDPNEVKFIKSMRLYLDVMDPLIVQRFGQIPYLVGKGYQSFKAGPETSIQDASWEMPSVEQLEKVSFEDLK